MCQAQFTRLTQVIREVFAEDLKCTLDTSPSRDCCPCGAAQVGIVEVCKAVGGAADLTTLPSLLPHAYDIGGTKSH